jgi:hypothetical protein
MPKFETAVFRLVLILIKAEAYVLHSVGSFGKHLGDFEVSVIVPLALRVMYF